MVAVEELEVNHDGFMNQKDPAIEQSLFCPGIGWSIELDLEIDGRSVDILVLVEG